VMLRTLDQHWREHLAAMDYMRQGIFLRSYAQKNPKQEYKREAFELFAAMLDRIKFDTVTTVSKVQVRSQAEIEREELERQQRLARALQLQHAEAVSPIHTGAASAEPVAESGNPFGGNTPGGGSRGGNALGGGGGGGGGPPGSPIELEPPRGAAGPVSAAPLPAAPFVRQVPKVGRNEMCPCGSGKKYKHCHGALQQASG